MIRAEASTALQFWDATQSTVSYHQNILLFALRLTAAKGNYSYPKFLVIGNQGRFRRWHA
jgi:hypothetical protein